jgi:hypothetical protein
VRRPSRPLVAMITAVAAPMITPLKMKNRAVLDPGTTSSESWLDRGVEAGMEDRHQQHPVSSPVVDPHEQGASEEQRDKLNGEETGAERSCSTPQPKAATEPGAWIHSATSSLGEPEARVAALRCAGQPSTG